MALLKHLQLSLICNQPSLVYFPDIRDYYIIQSVIKNKNKIYFDIFKYQNTYSISTERKKPKPIDFFTKIYKPNKYFFISTINEYNNIINSKINIMKNKRVIIIYINNINLLNLILINLKKYNPLNLIYRMFTKIPLFFKSLSDSSFFLSDINSFIINSNNNNQQLIIKELSNKFNITIYIKRAFLNKNDYLNKYNIIIHEEEIKRLETYYNITICETDELNICLERCSSLLLNNEKRTPIDSIKSYIGNEEGKEVRYFIPKLSNNIYILPEYIPLFSKEYRIILDENINKLIESIKLEEIHTKQWIDQEISYKEELYKNINKQIINKDNLYGINKKEELLLINKEDYNELFEVIIIINNIIKVNYKNINDIKRMLSEDIYNKIIKVNNRNIKNINTIYNINVSTCFYNNNIIYNEGSLFNINKYLISKCYILNNTIKFIINNNKEMKIHLDNIERVIILEDKRLEYKCLIKQSNSNKILIVLKLLNIPTLKENNKLLSFEDTISFIDSPDILIYCKTDFLLNIINNGIPILLEKIKGVDIGNGEICYHNNNSNNSNHLKLVSNSEIIKYYNKKEFNLYYLILCVISNNTSLLLYNFSINEIEFKENLLLFIITYQKKLNTFKEYLNKFSINNTNINTQYHRSLTIFSDRIEYNITFDITTSRILTMYDSDYFIKCKLDMPDNHLIYIRVLNSFKKILLGGIRIRNRRYKVLAASSNQLREKCLWFFSSYKRIINNNKEEEKKYYEIVNKEDIINKLGYNYPLLIGAKMIRIGLNLSNVFSYKYINYLIINDIYSLYNNKELLISDGIGRISFGLLISSLLSFALHKELNNNNNKYISLLETSLDVQLLICKIFKINYIPSAIQIRIGGFKGVVCLYPYKSHIDIPYLNKMIIIYNNINEDKKSSNNPYNNINVFNIKSEIPNNEILVLRNSMKKYDSDLKYLDIVGIAKSIKLYLNVQIIVLIEEMKGEKFIYMNFSDNFFYLLNKLLTTTTTGGRNSNKVLLGNLIGTLLGYDNSNNNNNNNMLKFLKNLINTQEKYKIPVFGRLLMGVLDEFNILESDEVYIQLSCICSINKKEKKNECDKNCKKSILGYTDYYLNEKNGNIKDIKEVIVYRNPLHRFSDIQKVKCVNKKQLKHLNNVIVFSSKLLKGINKTIFQICSGGDLDGDYYSVIFDKEIVELNKNNELKEPIVINQKLEEVYKESEEEFIIRNFQANRLGILSSIYNKLQDKFYSKHKDVYFLINKIEKEIDSFKKGPTNFEYKDLYKLLNIVNRTDLLNTLNIKKNEIITNELNINEILIEVNRILKQPKYEIPVNYLSIYNLYNSLNRKININKINNYYNSNKILNKINDTIHYLFDSYLINYIINKYDFMVLYIFSKFINYKVCDILIMIGLLNNNNNNNKVCSCNSLIEIYNKQNIIKINDIKYIEEYFFSNYNSSINIFNIENYFYILLNRIKKKTKIEYQIKANINNLTFQWPKISINNLKRFLINQMKNNCLNKFDLNNIDTFFINNNNHINNNKESRDLIKGFKYKLRDYLWKNKSDDIVGLFLWIVVDL